MVRALICSEDDLGDELADTVLGRDGVVRHVARRIEDARTLALAARPAIVMVDRDLPRADQLVAALREDSLTRGLSIAVVARGDFDEAELALLEVGANAILRLPAGPEWDARLNRLLSVPPRKQARFPVSFWVVASVPDLAGAVTATGLNLSLTGMLLETGVKGIDLGAELDFDIRLPGGDTLAGCGRVVRLAGPGQYGVEFAALAADAADAVLRFVETAGGH
jgi:DNA-binding response OmpR family regulator